MSTAASVLDKFIGRKPPPPPPPDPPPDPPPQDPNQPKYGNMWRICFRCVYFGFLVLVTPLFIFFFRSRHTGSEPIA